MCKNKKLFKKKEGISFTALLIFQIYIPAMQAIVDF